MFISDNTSGVHPDILTALERANTGDALPYGEDHLTQQVAGLLSDLFGTKVWVYFVFSGTAANVLILKAMARSFHSVLCTQDAHIMVSEAGAAEHFVGCKLVTVPGVDGKLNPELLAPLLTTRGSIHQNQPRALSISQSTERGTVYSLEELNNLVAFAKQHDLYLHVDGARIHNALAALGSDCRSLAQIDAIAFGGTKNGMMIGEAVVILNPCVNENFKYLQKQGMQLVSKARYLAAQYLAYFRDDLWLKSASHANKMAAYLGEQLQQFESVTLTAPVQTNMVFAKIPKSWVAKLQAQCPFLVWQAQDPNYPEIRLLTSFRTEKEKIDAFIAEVAKLDAPALIRS